MNQDCVSAYLTDTAAAAATATATATVTTQQSLTKYYDGHNMTVGGAIISASAELDTKMHFYQNINGNILSPQCAFIVLQSTKVCLLLITTYVSVVQTQEFTL